MARSGPASRPQASNLGAGGAWDGVDDGPLVGTGEAGPGRSEWVFMRPGSPAADAVAGVGGGLGGRCGGGEPDPAAGEDVQGRVASPFGPFVVLLGQVGADQTGHGGETSSTGRDAGTSLKASVAGSLAAVGSPRKDAPMALNNVPLPDSVFIQLPSGRDIVLKHQFKADTDRWRRELAIRQLPAPTGLLGVEGKAQISRKDLFTFAEPGTNS